MTHVCIIHVLYIYAIGTVADTLELLWICINLHTHQCISEKLSIADQKFQNLVKGEVPLNSKMCIYFFLSKI